MPVADAVAMVRAPPDERSRSLNRFGDADASAKLIKLCPSEWPSLAWNRSGLSPRCVGLRKSDILRPFLAAAKRVARATQYFTDPFVAPAWRAQWVERMDT